MASDPDATLTGSGGGKVTTSGAIAVLVEDMLTDTRGQALPALWGEEGVVIVSTAETGTAVTTGAAVAVLLTGGLACVVVTETPEAAACLLAEAVSACMPPAAAA